MNDSNYKFSIILDLILSYSVPFLELYTADCKKPEEYGEATLFEICVYLLLRLDLLLVQFKQQLEIRKKLILFIADNLVDKFSKVLKNDNLHKIISQRMDIYGRVVRNSQSEITPQKSLEVFLEGLHFHLINNIEFSRNTNELKFWDSGLEPLILVGIDEMILQKTHLTFVETHLVLSFVCCLKHLFQDNNDFTQLSLSEIEERIKDGVAEAKK